MILADKRFATAVESQVGEMEKETDAEIIVVAAPRSGSYRDVAYLLGGGVAIFTLLLLLFLPVDFPALFIPIDLVVCAALGAWIAHSSPAILWFTTSSSRRRRQVEAAARAEYLEEAVHGTKRHTGILVYLSELEQQVYVLPDPVLDGRVPRSAWTGLPLAPTTLDAFLGTLKAIGAVLTEHVPALAMDNPNEIPDAPRVRK